MNKEKKKEEVPLISDNQERLSVYLGSVQLLVQKIKKIQLETQVARDICLGMTSSFELLK